MMLQKRLASGILKCSPKRISMDPARLAEIKEAITKADMRNLIKTGAITAAPKRGVSRSRARKTKQKLRKRHRGPGSKKGTKNARLPKKTAWINRIRIQRRFLKELKGQNVIDNKKYRELYMKCKGGFFRSKRHIQLYLTELNIIKK